VATGPDIILKVGEIDIDIGLHWALASSLPGAPLLRGLLHAVLGSRNEYQAPVQHYRGDLESISRLSANRNRCRTGESDTARTYRCIRRRHWSVPTLAFVGKLLRVTGMDYATA